MNSENKITYEATESVRISPCLLPWECMNSEKKITYEATESIRISPCLLPWECMNSEINNIRGYRIHSNQSLFVAMGMHE